MPRAYQNKENWIKIIRTFRLHTKLQKNGKNWNEIRKCFCMRATIGYIFASMVESVKFLFDLIKLQCHHRQCTFDEQNFVCVRPDICGERKSDTMCVACKKIYILPFSNKWQEKQPKKNTQKEKEKRKTLPSTGRKKKLLCVFISFLFPKILTLWTCFCSKLE